MKILIGHRITGPLGVVHNTRFINCFWPRLSQPTSLFAKNSYGIEVFGSAHNVEFPYDTVFLDYSPSALYLAQQEVLEAFNLHSLRNLTDRQAAAWQAAYNSAEETALKKTRKANAVVKSKEKAIVKEEALAQRVANLIRRSLRMG